MFLNVVLLIGLSLLCNVLYAIVTVLSHIYERLLFEFLMKYPYQYFQVMHFHMTHV